MKYLPLVWSGIWRKPGRTILILLQVALATSLFGMLQGLKSGVEQSVANMRADVLFVGPAVGGGPPPVAYQEQIAAIPGVKAVTHADFMIGTYQQPTQLVAALAVDPSNGMIATMAPDLFTIPPADLAALHKTRTGALISEDIGRKYGWHIGDRIPIASTTVNKDGSANWAFDVVGHFTDHEPGEASLIVINYDYLNEGRVQGKDTVRNFYALISDPQRAADMSASIDAAFANSPVGTQTTSLKEIMQLTLKAIGDLSLAIGGIISAVLVALLFSTSTMMMQTMRERTPELAVLKTVGFTDRAVFWMLVVEAVGVCVAAAALGLGLATLIFPYAAKFVAGLSMPLLVVVAGLLGAALIALISVAVPAWQAARLQVVDGLAGR